MPREYTRIPAAERFLAKIQKTDTCWLWLAAKDQEGYGIFTTDDGKWIKAHRYAYEHFNQPPRTGEIVRHTCDTRLCVNPAHLTLAKVGDQVPRTRRDPVERFMARIEQRPDGCWLWTGARASVSGYGVINFNGRAMTTHRFAYEQFVGPIPAGVYICHTCDVRACCNPAHLFAGSQAANMADCARKQRTNAPRGEQNVAALLTDDTVREIRRLAAAGVPQVALASRFGVSRRTVLSVVSRETWRHVT